MPGKLLVVEDNADAREMLVLVLREQGFVVTEAADGQAALSLVESDPPDLIITDIQMPKLDGINLIKELRVRPELGNVPILVLTAFHSGIASEALKAGANAAASKPLPLGSLIQLINKLLLPSIIVWVGHLYRAPSLI